MVLSVHTGAASPTDRRAVKRGETAARQWSPGVPGRDTQRGAGQALALQEEPALSTDVRVLCRTSDSFLPTIFSKINDARNSSGRKVDGKLNHRRRVICGLSQAFRCKYFGRPGWAPGSCDRFHGPSSTRLVRTTNPTRLSHLSLMQEHQTCSASRPFTM